MGPIVVNTKQRVAVLAAGLAVATSGVVTSVAQGASATQQSTTDAPAVAVTAPQSQAD
jgi:F0F1-type ATP synthase membrane subunit c/vacuolar-type H+-ATPase subunit K